MKINIPLFILFVLTSNILLAQSKTEIITLVEQLKNNNEEPKHKIEVLEKMIDAV